MYNYDERIVMTLDAGGTNFVFSAIQANREVVTPITLPSHANNLQECLKTLVEGFESVIKLLPTPPVAISFAFPGPADYVNGVIGDLPNFPSFRGGIALGPYLRSRFNIPVYINNDGNLFAYGEALAGALPSLNKKIEEAGYKRRYRNLLGITLGTGFGGGAVINNILLTGDNGCGGDVWIFRNKKYKNMIAEESVSIRAVIRVYEEKTGEKHPGITPKDIFDIAEGTQKGDQNAAKESFAELGEIAGDVIAQADSIVDGIVVIGGGLTGASRYIMPSLVKEMQQRFSTFAGDSFPRMQTSVYNLDDPEEAERFLELKENTVKIPGGKESVPYLQDMRIGVITSEIGTSRAISLGAYAFALSSIDAEEK
ncbi:ROK family protein [Coprobacter tertius]|uniref:ROK family protein n=1 Tax=Coprobacter tertius TaxID=2944915 RepID=A0ABT1MFU5_9BACT|nr:ROK family protein [Coprobacter tertius]MCP9611497.1 ROK family protein [Coprobacter tertius]